MQPCTFDYKQGLTFNGHLITITVMLCNATPSRTTGCGKHLSP